MSGEALASGEQSAFGAVPAMGDVPAMGGERTVPGPGPVARDYLLLALRLDQRIPGLVDGYFGPAELKAQVDMEQLAAPARLQEDAASLLERLDTEIDDPARRAWLRAQVAALHAHASRLAGEELPYVEFVRRCFEVPPRRRPEGAFARAAAELERLLPGRGWLRGRLDAWDAAMTIPPERVPAAVDWLVARFRERAATLFGLPAGESLSVGFVREQPWSGYNWYHGGGRSRVDLNVDLPIRAPDLLHVVAHETYPGHHLEHAFKEAELVGRDRRLEASILLINTPECLVSEGLAEAGHRFAAPPGEEVEVLVELLAIAGIEPDGDRREAAERQINIGRARRVLGGATLNAALMRHGDGRDRDAVLEYLESVALLDPGRAARRLEFIEHPLWRTYQLVYPDGRALVERWLDAVPAGERAARFRRLLVEQLTPLALDRDAVADDGSISQPEADDGSISRPEAGDAAAAS